MTTKQHRERLSGPAENIRELVPEGGMSGRIEDLERHLKVDGK